MTSKFQLTLIFFIAILTRLFALYYLRDAEVANEWGILLENLEKNRILSVHSVQGVPVPNIFMPPLYPIFLYCVKFFFQNVDLFLWVIQYIQLLFALISVYLTYKILTELFSNNIALIGTLIFTIFPLNVFAVSQISSSTLQILLLNFSKNYLINIFLHSPFQLVC